MPITSLITFPQNINAHTSFHAQTTIEFPNSLTSLDPHPSTPAESPIQETDTPKKKKKKKRREDFTPAKHARVLSVTP
jgi:hypothetical protein